MPRKFNFGAGPATMPESVLTEVQEELLDWNGLGLSVMEISHRSPEFIEIAKQAECDIEIYYLFLTSLLCYSHMVEPLCKMLWCL